MTRLVTKRSCLSFGDYVAEKKVSPGLTEFRSLPNHGNGYRFPCLGQPRLLPPVVRTTSQHTMLYKLDYKTLFVSTLHYSI